MISGDFASGRCRLAATTPRIHVTKSPDGRNLIAKVGQLEVRVRVHQARQNRHVTEVALALVTAGGRTPQRDDPAAIDRHPAVPDRRLGDRHEPPRAIADQWEMTRSCLPARLRAG